MSTDTVSLELQKWVLSMIWWKYAQNHSVLYKLIMAITGIMMVGFLIAHLAGNLLIFAGTDSINQYSLKLREFPVLIWGARAGLLLAVISHIIAAIKLSIINKQARPQGYAYVKRVKASYASQVMLASGILLLTFIIYHLAHFTLRWTHQELFALIEEHDVYSMVILSFKSFWVTGFYTLAIVILMTHLYHGMMSFFQTLGINHSKYNTAIKVICPSLTFILIFGFLSIPLAIFLGFVG